MADVKKKMTPITAIRGFFGMKPGETLAEFLAEVKALSDEERLNIAKLCADELGVELDTKPAVTS